MVAIPVILGKMLEWKCGYFRIMFLITFFLFLLNLNNEVAFLQDAS
jgi:hypothetical protein